LLCRRNGSNLPFALYGNELLEVKSQWGKKVRFLSVCLEIGKEKDKALASLKQELKDVEIYFFKPETRKETFEFLLNSLPFLIIADENTNVVFEGSPKSINLTNQITALLSTEKKNEITAEKAKKMKQFFSDPQFLQLINSQLDHKKAFDFKFSMEIYRNFDKSLGKTFEEIKKPKLTIEYHVAHSEFVSNLLTKIFTQFPKELFNLSEKCIQRKEKQNLCILFMRNQIKTLLPNMAEENFSMVIAQNFNTNRYRTLSKEKKALLFLGEWPKNDDFKTFKSNVTAFKYFFDGPKTILSKFDFLFFNETEKKLIKGLLSEQKFFAQSHFKNLCELLRSEKWIEEWGKEEKGFKYDFNVIISFYKIIILKPGLEQKDVVFTKPALQICGDEEEIGKLENLVGKSLYSIIDPTDFSEINKEIEKNVNKLLNVLI